MMGRGEAGASVSSVGVCVWSNGCACVWGDLLRREAGARREGE